MKETIQKEVVNDYFTAGIKAEVILDMLLRPVLEKTLGQLLGGEDQEVRFITKEFPIPTPTEANDNHKNDNHNCNVDYLMHGEKAVYVIELKTSSTSEDEDQLNNYIDQIFGQGRLGKKFGPLFGERFIWMLNHVSASGIGDGVFPEEEERDYLNNLKNPLNDYIKSFSQEELTGETLGKSHIRQWMKCENRNGEGNCAVPAWLYLEALVDKIISKQEKNIEYKNTAHTENAIQYLRETKKSGSAKYLFQAGQILDSSPESWWDKKVQLVYIVPDKTTFETKLKKVIDKSKLERVNVISIEDIRDQLNDNVEYEKMLKDILDEICLSLETKNAND